MAQSISSLACLAFLGSQQEPKKREFWISNKNKHQNHVTTEGQFLIFSKGMTYLIYPIMSNMLSYWSIGREDIASLALKTFHWPLIEVNPLEILRHLLNPKQYVPYGDMNSEYVLTQSSFWFDIHKTRYAISVYNSVPRRFGRRQGIHSCSPTKFCSLHNISQYYTWLR